MFINLLLHKKMTEIKYRTADIELIRREHKNKLFLYIGTFFIAAVGLSIGVLILLLFLGRIDGTY
jgi:hypothetical protein